jgi:hypothetical protein
VRTHVDTGGVDVGRDRGGRALEGDLVQRRWMLATAGQIHGEHRALQERRQQIQQELANPPPWARTMGVTSPIVGCVDHHER